MRIKIVRAQGKIQIRFCIHCLYTYSYTGSIQGIEEIPSSIKAVFKTAWEIGPQPVIDLAVDRAPFVCQSQSMSVYMENPTPSDLVSPAFKKHA